METNYTDCGIYKYVCDFVLENIKIHQLIDVAKECVFCGTNSKNLLILAGLSEKFDAWDTILRYYKLTLDELNIKEPNKKEAAIYLTNYYCKELVDKKISPEIFLEKIGREIYYKSVFEYDNKITGDSIGIENLLALYYSIDELNEIESYYINDGNNKNCEHEKLKLYNECYKEAEEYLKIGL